MFVYILMGGIFILSLIVQNSLKSKFAKYSKVPLGVPMAGRDVANAMLQQNGCGDVQVTSVSGQLTDHFNPANRTVNLSEPVYGTNSIAAAAVAAHECGHACQASDGMPAYKIRQMIAPFAGIASKISVWIAIAGVFVMYLASRATSLSYDLGYWICTLGIALYALVFLFYLVTLPIERNASKRGLEAMKNCGWVSDSQLKAAKKVLWAAGDTYAVALASSAVTLLRLLLLRGGRRRR
jgi:Zn-dependent membrane protease YugP